MRTLATLLLLTAATACGGKHAATVGNHGASTAVTIEPLERTVPATEDSPEAPVRKPRVTVPGNPTASAAINSALGIPATADQLDAGGDVSIDFDVGYNADGLLDVTLVHETLGAYPDSYFEHFLFDTATGARLTGAELFRAEAMPELAKLIDGKLQAALTAARTGNPTDDCETDNDELYQGSYTVDGLRDVALTDRGVVFLYDFDFPHAMQACEPGDEFVLSIADLKPYLRDDSPLARLAK